MPYGILMEFKYNHVLDLVRILPVVLVTRAITNSSQVEKRLEGMCHRTHEYRSHQTTRLCLIKKWLRQPVTRQIEGLRVTFFDVCFVSCQIGSSSPVKGRWIACLQPQGQLILTNISVCVFRDRYKIPSDILSGGHSTLRILNWGAFEFLHTFKKIFLKKFNIGVKKVKGNRDGGWYRRGQLWFLDSYRAREMSKYDQSH